MNLLVVLAILVLLVWLLTALKIKPPTKDGSLAFQRREPFLSPAERSFLGVLEQALDSSYRVFGKVRLSDLVKPAKGLSNSKRVSALNKVNQKHVDYVICSTTDLAVVGVVELDDQSHGREDRVERDVFVDEALSGAGIPIARFSAKKGYQIQEVKTKLAETLSITLVGPSSTLSQAQEPSPPQPVSERELGPTLTIAQPQPIETKPMCEKCGATMIKRRAKNGEHAGKLFWACSTFPKCRQVMAITDR